MRHRFEFTLKETGMVIAVASFVATIFGIVLSFLVCDKWQKRGWFCFIANFVTAVSYLGIIKMPVLHRYFVIIPLFFHQLGFSIFMSNMWPALTILIHKLHPEMDPD